MGAHTNGEGFDLEKKLEIASVCQNHKMNAMRMGTFDRCLQPWLVTRGQGWLMGWLAASTMEDGRQRGGTMMRSLLLCLFELVVCLSQSRAQRSLGTTMVDGKWLVSEEDDAPAVRLPHQLNAQLQLRNGVNTAV